MKKLIVINLALLLSIISYAQIIVDPVVDTIEICIGDTTQLEINVTGGTGSYTYDWSPSIGLSDTTIANPYASPDTTNIYTIIVSDGGINDTANILVIIHELPIADAGIDVTIPGGCTIMLNGSASGGSGYYLYDWQPSDMLQDSNICNPYTVYLYCSQVYTLIVTDSITSCQSGDIVHITVTGITTEINIISSQEKICEGDTTELSVHFECEDWLPYIYSYTWSSIPAGFNSSDTGINVFPSDTTFFIIDIDTWGSHMYDTIIIPVIHPPIAQFISNSSSNTISFNNQSLYATSYLWDFGDGNTDTIENPVHTYQNIGNYIVTLYASNECFTDSVQQDIITSAHIINEENQIEVVSNNNSVTIIGKELRKIELLDSKGQLIENYNVNTDKFILNLNNKSSGVYILKVNDGRRVERIVVQ